MTCHDRVSPCCEIFYHCSFQKTFVTLPSEIKRRMNGDQTERLSQTGECRNEGECCLLESASAFARGVLEEIKALAGTTSCKSVQLVRLKKLAQEQGCWFDDHSLFLVDHDDPRRTLMNSSMPTTSMNGEGRLFEHIIMMILGYDITSIGLESTVKRHQQTVGVKDNVHYCLYGVRMC